MTRPQWYDSNVKRLVCASFLCFTLSPLIGIRLPASVQNLVVLVLDAKSGKPLSKVDVYMISWNGAEEVDPHTASHEGQVLDHAVTDSGGRAVFVLPERVPEHVGFILGPSTDFTGCWTRKAFSPGEIMGSGVIAEYKQSKCGKLAWQPSTKPGEIVIIDKKLSVGQRMRTELP